MNRFSWFKRTVSALGTQVAGDPQITQIKADMLKFQNFIGNASYPLGLHLTGPLRAELKKVENHEQVPLPLRSAPPSKGCPNPNYS